MKFASQIKLPVGMVDRGCTPPHRIGIHEDGTEAEHRTVTKMGRQRRHPLTGNLVGSEAGTVVRWLSPVSNQMKACFVSTSVAFDDVHHWVFEFPHEWNDSTAERNVRRHFKQISDAPIPTKAEWATIFAEIGFMTAREIEWEIEQADKLDLCRQLAKVLSAKLISDLVARELPFTVGSSTAKESKSTT